MAVTPDRLELTIEEWRHLKGVLAAWPAYEQAWATYARAHHELMRHLKPLRARLDEARLDE